ncbi:glycoside hydrolase, partial [bacterium]|nr:glycoside hydrolase [bacterium]
MKFVLKIFCLFLLVANVFIAPSHSRVDGEKKKTSTGKSYLYSTRVERFERPSYVAKEFAAERVWSGHDDWEPAIAVDPSSAYVYQMTTRYTGKRPCDICRLPAIVFRSSSDGGETWGPDRFIALTHRSQNDPQIEVANDGTIYAVFLNDFVPGIKFTKSNDHGVTWTDPIRLTGAGRKPSLSDKPVLTISANGQHVY